MEDIELDEEEEAYQQQRLAERQAVEAQIRQAFSTTEYPGDDCLRFCDPKFTEGIVGRKWQDLSDEFIEYNYCDLDFLTDEGYRYYLPAWLVQSLQDVDGSMVELTASWHLITGLPMYPDSTSSHMFAQAIEPMTFEQKSAIRSYLEYFTYGDDDPNNEYVRALNDYWRQFAKKKDELETSGE